jgi:hypothetical protein
MQMHADGVKRKYVDPHAEEHPSGEPKAALVVIVVS